MAIAAHLSSTETGDCDDLEALFDAVAAETAVETRPAPVAVPPVLTTVVQMQPASTLSATTPTDQGDDEMIKRIGKMTRKLHDSLKELGYDKVIEDAVGTMPDTRDRLAYISTLTKQAAERVLNATEIARPIQDKLEAEASGLSQGWAKMLGNQLTVEDFKALVERTRAYLDEVPKQTRATNAQLTDIMMAQDFQDLTGQVIKKVTEAAQNIEGQMLQLLLEHAPPEKRLETGSGLLNGPVINAQGRNDIVTDQAQVDDLLESLGF